MIIQAILVPRDVSMETLVAEKGLEWLSEASLEERKEFDRYVRFTQLPVEKFDKDSMMLTKVSDKGVWVLGGEVLEAEDEKGAMAVKLNEEMTTKLADIQPSPMNMPIAEMEVPAVKVTFRDMFERELSNFVNVVTGLMGQSAADKGARKDAIMDALDAFSSFLDMSLDSIGEKSVKFDGSFEDDNTTEKEEEVEDMFETKEEFAAAVTEIVIAVIDEREKAAKEAAAKEKEGDAGKEKDVAVVTPAALEAMEASIAEIKKTVKEFTEKTEKTLNGLSSDPASAEPQEKDTDKGKTDPDVKKSVFGGLFIRKRAVG